MIIGSIIPTTTLTTTHEVLNEYPQETITGKGEFKATIRYLCNWSDRFAFVGEVLGGPTGMGYGFVLRTPHLYPNYLWAHATGVVVNPFDKNAPPTKAVIDVTYETDNNEREDSAATDVYMTQNFEGSAEFFPIEASNLTYDVGGTEAVPTSMIPGKLMRGYVWTINYKKLPYVPVELGELIGSINDRQHRTTFKTKGEYFYWNAGNMLFGVPVIRAERMITGQIIYELTLTINIKVDPDDNQAVDLWNKVYKLDDSDGKLKPAYAYINGHAFKPYVAKDWSRWVPTSDW